jgi:hypothetical protein
MVYLSDPHEAVEKSMWCYLNGMVPLVGEKDPVIAMSEAAAYRVDSLITDVQSISKLAPYLEAPAESLVAITVLGETFDIETLAPFGRYAPLRLLQCDADGNAVAVCLISEYPAFRPL